MAGGNPVPLSGGATVTYWIPVVCQARRGNWVQVGDWGGVRGSRYWRVSLDREKLSEEALL